MTHSNSAELDVLLHTTPAGQPAALDFEPLPAGTDFNVLFVYPNTRFRKVHLGLAILSACVKQIGAHTELCDMTMVPPHLRAEVLRNRLQKSKPDLVAITAMSPEWPAASELVRVCQALGVSHVLGGAQATEQPEVSMEVADLLVVGEGEGALMDLVRALARHAPAHAIPNVWARMPDGRLARNPRRPLIEDLDQLPFPDWRLFHNMHYESPPDFWTRSAIEAGERLICAQIEGSRGCPYRCSYCSNASKKDAYDGGGKWRREKSPRRIVDELKAFRALYGGLDRVIWVDEIWMTGMKRLRELCAVYRREIGAAFTIKERPEQVNETKMKLASEAGLLGVSFGLESGDPRIRKEVLNRQVPDEVLKRAFRLAQQCGVRTCAYVMVGIPGEDQRALLRTWKALRQVKPDMTSVTLFRPMRGTPLYDYCVRQRLYDPRHDSTPWGSTPLIIHDRLDSDTIVRYHRLLSQFGARRGAYPVLAFHIGRRWNWACRLFLRQRTNSTRQSSNSGDSGAAVDSAEFSAARRLDADPARVAVSRAHL